VKRLYNQTFLEPECIPYSLLLYHDSLQPKDIFGEISEELREIMGSKFTPLSFSSREELINFLNSKNFKMNWSHFPPLVQKFR